MNSKTCKRCQLSRPLSMFHKKVGGLHGVDSACKSCISINKRKKFLFKKEAKKKRASNRSTLLELNEASVELKAVEVTGAEIEETFYLLAEAINNYRLNIWDEQLWGRKPSKQESCVGSLTVG